MNVTILSGSPRNGSNTLKLSKAIAKIVAELNPQYQCNLINFEESDIPLPNQGALQFNNPTPFQKRIIHSLSGPGYVFVCTPEYNWLPSADLINFINQFATKSNLDLFNNKHFALAGVSAGRGGRIPTLPLATALNKIIGFFDLNSYVSGKIFESQFTPQVVDSDGNLLNNDQFNQGLQSFVQYNIRPVKIEI